MFASKLQTIRLLNGLRLIHHERINGYNKAIGLLNYSDTINESTDKLKRLLSDLVRDSIFLSATLENIVLIEGGKMPYGIKVDQQLFKVIRHLKMMFAEMSQSDILSGCRQCEADLQQAYDIVLNESGLAADPKEILYSQQQNLKKALNDMMAITHETVQGYTAAA